MTTISSTRMAPMQPALSLLQSGLGSSAAGAEAGGAPGHGPATKVSLSDDAKSIMARAKAEQKVADQLRSYLDASQGKGRGRAKAQQAEDVVEFSAPKGAAAKNEADPGAEILAKYGELPGAKRWAAAARADNLGLLKDGISGANLDGMVQLYKQAENNGGIIKVVDANACVKINMPHSEDDRDFVVSQLSMLARTVIDLEKNGKNESAQALRDAVASGTIKFQRASDVADLNSRYENYHFADAGGGGTAGGLSDNPKGKIKEALDQGRARHYGAVDRGAFYISW